MTSGTTDCSYTGLSRATLLL